MRERKKLAQLLGYAVLTCGCEGDIASEITFHQPVLALVRQARDQKAKSLVLVGKVGGVVVLRPHLIAAVHLVEEMSVSSDRLLQADALKIATHEPARPRPVRVGWGPAASCMGNLGASRSSRTSAFALPSLVACSSSTLSRHAKMESTASEHSPRGRTMYLKYFKNTGTSVRSSDDPVAKSVFSRFRRTWVSSNSFSGHGKAFVNFHVSRKSLNSKKLAAAFRRAQTYKSGGEGVSRGRGFVCWGTFFTSCWGTFFLHRQGCIQCELIR